MSARSAGRAMRRRAKLRCCQKRVAGARGARASGGSVLARALLLPRSQNEAVAPESTELASCCHCRAGAWRRHRARIHAGWRHAAGVYSYSQNITALRLFIPPLSVTLSIKCHVSCIAHLFGCG